MNYLAHLYLSGNDHGLIVGNFIGDAVKGDDYENYPEEIKKGILLHRAIDTFTDSHSIVDMSVSRIRESQGKFSPIVIDIFYDHVLAKNWTNYSKTSLNEYVENIHQILMSKKHLMPLEAQEFLKYMIKYNWLESYASVEGISDVLRGMSQRTSYSNKMNKAGELLAEVGDELEKDFASFFAALKKYVRNEQ